MGDTTTAKEARRSHRGCKVRSEEERALAVASAKYEGQQFRSQKYYQRQLKWAQKRDFKVQSERSKAEEELELIASQANKEIPARDWEKFHQRQAKWRDIKARNIRALEAQVIAERDKEAGESAAGERKVVPKGQEVDFYLKEMAWTKKQEKIRQMQQELNRAAEMEQCTFAPKIHDPAKAAAVAEEARKAAATPDSRRGSNALRIYERNTKWLENRKKWLAAEQARKGPPPKAVHKSGSAPVLTSTPKAPARWSGVEVGSWKNRDSELVELEEYLDEGIRFVERNQDRKVGSRRGSQSLRSAGSTTTTPTSAVSTNGASPHGTTGASSKPVREAWGDQTEASSWGKSMSPATDILRSNFATPSPVDVARMKIALAKNHRVSPEHKNLYALREKNEALLRSVAELSGRIHEMGMSPAAMGAPEGGVDTPSHAMEGIFGELSPAVPPTQQARPQPAEVPVTIRSMLQDAGMDAQHGNDGRRSIEDVAASYKPEPSGATASSGSYYEAHKVSCRMTPGQAYLYSHILASEDWQLLVHKDEPCECGSGTPRGDCCRKSNKEGQHWSLLIDRCVKLIQAVGDHLDLVSALQIDLGSLLVCFNETAGMEGGRSGKFLMIESLMPMWRSQNLRVHLVFQSDALLRMWASQTEAHGRDSVHVISDNGRGFMDGGPHTQFWLTASLASAAGSCPTADQIDVLILTEGSIEVTSALRPPSAPMSMPVAVYHLISTESLEEQVYNARNF